MGKPYPPKADNDIFHHFYFLVNLLCTSVERNDMEQKEQWYLSVKARDSKEIQQCAMITNRLIDLTTRFASLFVNGLFNPTSAKKHTKNSKLKIENRFHTRSHWYILKRCNFFIGRARQRNLILLKWVG